MPRGRKGPPQESVDSILLAISRRNDIDPDTLTHYLDRLDEEWAEGAREKVLNLLRSNDTMAQSAAIHILAELVTDFDLDDLEDFVADPTVSDMAKLSLAPILKELGSDMADDGIIEYLNDPSSAIRQMQLRLLELVGQSEMGVETILEDVVTMPVERRLAFISWLGNSQDPRAASLLVPLLENQTGKIVLAVIDALEQLGPIAVHQSLPALNHVITTTSNRGIKQHARSSLGRLTMQSALGAEDTAQLQNRQQHLTVYEVRASFIDGSGTQLIILSWLRPDGLIKGVNVLYHEQLGIKDCYGIDEMNVERWHDLVSDLEGQGFNSFEIPLAYGRALIMEARVLNKRSRHKLPVAYSIWRPLIEGSESSEESQDSNSGPMAKKGAVRFPTALEPLPLTPDVVELERQGADLYQLSEFTSWMFEPVSRIEPYITRYWTTFSPAEASSIRSHRRSSARSKQKEAGQKALLETLVTEAVSDLIDDAWRMRYELRLRRQAALFHCVERNKDVQLIRAVAAVLHPDSQIPVQEQSFPLAMLRTSIEQGPLRLIVESLSNGNPGSLPIDFFSQE